MAKDPICGMEVDEKEAKKKGLLSKKNNRSHYFCSLSCKQKFESATKWYKAEKFGKSFPYFLALILIIGSLSSLIFDFMLLYMGLFFIVFSLFKMPDWKGFVEAYRQYDLLAKAVPFYAWIYPALEFILGAWYLVNYFTDGFILLSLAWITLMIMGFGGIGVGIKLAKKEKFQCACLGTKLNIPLTKVTLLEDIIMVLMALGLIIGL